ncbi:unnamed protein product [Arctia plantaginis]|uniref:Uncharacterized protein n=1 Tax=Arctia plantaginis TaxID=874455 RepID=A0A8S1AF93_ARCPL|nr:unnamed protein product [Arctia plantaginis]
MLQILKFLSHVKPLARLHGCRTNWNMFRFLLESSLNIILKTEEKIMLAVEYFNESIQKAAWDRTSAAKKHTFLTAQSWFENL